MTFSNEWVYITMLSDQDIKIRINPKFKADKFHKIRKIEEVPMAIAANDKEGGKNPKEEVDLEIFTGSIPLREKKEKIYKLVNHMVEDNNLFKKFQAQKGAIKDPLYINERVLEPLMDCGVDNIAQRN